MRRALAPSRVCGITSAASSYRSSFCSQTTCSAIRSSAPTGGAKVVEVIIGYAMPTDDQSEQQRSHPGRRNGSGTVRIAATEELRLAKEMARYDSLRGFFWAMPISIAAALAANRYVPSFKGLRMPYKVRLLSCYYPSRNTDAYQKYKKSPSPNEQCAFTVVPPIVYAAWRIGAPDGPRGFDRLTINLTNPSKTRAPRISLRI